MYFILILCENHNNQNVNVQLNEEKFEFSIKKKTFYDLKVIKVENPNFLYEKGVKNEYLGLVHINSIENYNKNI